MGKKKSKKADALFSFKWILCSLLVILLLSLYLIFFASNVNTKPVNNFFYVQRYSPVSEIADSLEMHGIISNTWTFSFVSKILEYNTFRPGLYKIEKGWSNFILIRHLKTDSLRPSVEIKILPVHLRKNLIRQICKASYIKEKDLNSVLKDSNFLEALGGFTKESVYTIFIPQNYRVYKNIRAKEFLEIAYSGFCKFWNEERLEKAEEIGYTPEQLSILASIVYSETKNIEEMPMIAGLYLNRLNKGMRLESDPTLVYATGKFSSKRILRKYMEVNSAYNTYRRKGLPPGPIYTVPAYAIDAVLNYIPHDFIFFCAKDDFSGCHTFSESFQEHKINASRYRKELDKRKIN